MSVDDLFKIMKGAYRGKGRRTGTKGNYRYEYNEPSTYGGRGIVRVNDRSLANAVTVIDDRIEASPAYKKASEQVVSTAIDIIGRDIGRMSPTEQVSRLRELGGLSNIAKMAIDKITKDNTENMGSQMIPTTLAEHMKGVGQLSKFRLAIQTALSKL